MVILPYLDGNLTIFGSAFGMVLGDILLSFKSFKSFKRADIIAKRLLNNRPICFSLIWQRFGKGRPNIKKETQRCRTNDNNFFMNFF